MSLEPVVWSDEYSVGVKDIDDDHKRLILVFNELLAACSAGLGDAIIGKTIETANRDTRLHFTREEHLLEAIGYPRLMDHQQEHRALLRQLESISGQLSAGAHRGLDAEVLGFLRDWVVRHVLSHDQAYADFLKSTSIAD